jgi:hypothetical protein
MPHVCSKCARVNPPEAVYCYFDGVVITNGQTGGGPAPAGPVSIGQKAFSSPFTLPSGKVCQNFDQLALGCQENWKGAVDALKQGYLEKFLAGQGRADLAQAARQAAAYPDKDRGLAQFLEKLPSQAVQPPKLTVEPTDINLGALASGTDRKVELKLENQGMRLVYGSITLGKGSEWLSLGTAGQAQKLFQFGSEAKIPVIVQGKRLRASNKPLEGKLIIESNAGDFIISVKADVPVKAYPSGALAGAKSPRQVAEKAKANPKDAAAEFEKGAVAQWYKDNGWAYPVKLPSASGLGAVQQFFEALGLTPPPKVDVSEKAVNLRGEIDQPVRHQIEVRSQEKRPVYAHATADQPWLEVGKARLNGRVATIPLNVAKVPNRPGETLKANLMVTSNGGQKFRIPVTLTIGAAGAAFAFGGPGEPLVAVRKPRGQRVALWPLLLLLLLLGVVAGWDLMKKQQVAVIPTVEDVKDTVVQKAPSADAIKPYDQEPRIAISFTPDTSRFGISCTRLKDPRYAEKPKLLTRYDNGHTNNTIVRIDGFDYVFGRELPNAKYFRDRKGVLWKELRDKENPRKWVTIMDWRNERITVTQTIEIVVGEATRLYDTALIKYEVENKDTKIHTIGLRVMMDTYIGANDGVPFEIGPSPDVPTHPMVDSKEVFEKAKVPDFVRAIEDPNDLAGKNTTIAEMGLKLRGFEQIQKLVICRWPQEQGASEARWEWNYEAMNVRPNDLDSCVLIYWSKVEMSPQEKRKFGFTYGLGRIAGEQDTEDGTVVVKGSAKLRLFARPGVVKKPTVVSAYMKGADGQTVKLELPPELRFASSSQAEQPVKAEPGKPVAQVSWGVIADKPGSYKVKATLTDGTVAEEIVRIGDVSIFD